MVRTRDMHSAVDLLTPDMGNLTDVMEVSLLLTGWQVAALENAARDRGLTAGQMVRHLIHDYFTRLEGAGGDPEKAAAAVPW